jgi:hypothetical protein
MHRLNSLILILFGDAVVQMLIQWISTIRHILRR